MRQLHAKLQFKTFCTLMVCWRRYRRRCHTTPIHGPILYLQLIVLIVLLIKLRLICGTISIWKDTRTFCKWSDACICNLLSTILSTKQITYINNKLSVNKLSENCYHHLRTYQNTDSSHRGYASTIQHIKKSLYSLCMEPSKPSPTQEWEDCKYQGLSHLLNSMQWQAQGGKKKKKIVELH